MNDIINKEYKENIFDGSGKLNITDFILSDQGYKGFWKDANKSKNSFLAEEQLTAVERRIIWSCNKINMNNVNAVHKVSEIAAETMKYHIAGEASIQDSVKGCMTYDYRQPCTVLLRGIGNLPNSQTGSPGAQPRYLSCTGTPLLSAIIDDIQFIDKVKDETGLEQPEYVSLPIPRALIKGVHQIGIGRSCIIVERDARAIIDWIEDMFVFGNENSSIPNPITQTSADIYENKSNGYVYVTSEIIKDGKFDVITSIPPKNNARTVMNKLKSKLQQKVAEKIKDGSGNSKDVAIYVPSGYITEKDYIKFGLRTARKEAPFIWDTELDTMRLSDLREIAEIWFNDRKRIVTLRLESNKAANDVKIKKIDLIKLFVEKEMNKWTVDKITKELGEEDANIVLSQPQRAFLKENLEKNSITRDELVEKNNEINNLIENVGQVVIDEARDIIEVQEEFFNNSNI